MKKGKSFLSVLLALLMLFNLTVLTSAEEKPELKITANVTEITQGTGTADIVYTVKVDPKGNQIAAFSFKLVAPEGMTLAQDEVDDEGADGYWLNSDLIYNKKYTPNGPFTTFEYAPTTGYFGASGGIEGRKLASEETIMTIKATVDISVARVYTFGDVDFICGSDGDTTFVNPTTSIASVTIKGAHTHVFDQKNTDAKYLASAASCTAKATYFYSCECGEKGTETFESGETLPHTASTEWKSDETGHWHVCKDCGAKLQVIEHTPDHEGGATETYPIKCTECGYVIEAQLDHTHSFTQEVAEAKYLKSDADCTKDAVYYKSCTCGVASTTDTFIATGTALGHSWGQHVADKNRKSPADCENPAVYYVSCGRCDARDTENTFTYGEKLGHKGGEWQSDETGHWMVCVRCSNEFNKADHQPLDGTPNCVNDAVCQVCGYEVAKSDSSIHTKIVKVEAKAATCTENGNIEHYKCTGCGKLFSDKAGATEIAAEDVVIPAAHKLTAVAEKPSNCRVPGTAAYDKCDVCGKMFDKDGKEITEPTALPLAAHTWDTTKWLANKDGHYRECKVCGIADTVITPHTPGAAATETTPQTCTECGYIIAPATGHGDNHVKGNLVSDATSHWYACTGCSDQLEKANHTVTDWTIDKEATTTEEGLRHGNCTVCGHVVYEKIAKTTPVNPGPGPNKPTKPGTKDDGKKVESGKTFDAGIGVYVGLSILSLTGSAVVIGKKRKTR